MDTALIAAVAAAIGAVATRAFDYLSARKMGLGPLNAMLVKTLQSTVDAQSSQIAAQATQITGLTEDLRDERHARSSLERRVAELEHALASRAIRIDRGETPA